MTLEVRNVSKAWGGVRVLDDISLSVPADGMTGLIGPNGAGKSTLFAIISGFADADHGHLEFATHSLDRLAARRRAELGLLRTFQVPRPFGHLSVRDNLAVAACDQSGEQLWDVFFRRRKVRARDAAIAEQADEIIDFLNLRRVAALPARQLSGGQAKLLELGRILMAKPRMILLDEPFAGVNPVLYAQIAERICALHARGIGFLIVEHNLPVLSAMVERMIVMDQGAILAQGTPDEVLSNPTVRDAYIGGA